MRWQAWIVGITAVCLLQGCASSRGSSFAARDKSAPSVQSDDSESTAKSSTRRSQFKAITLQPREDSKVSSRKATAPAGRKSQPVSNEEDGQSKPTTVRHAIGSDDQADEAAVNETQATDSSQVVLISDQAASENPTTTTEGTTNPTAALPIGYPLSLDNVLFIADSQNPNVAFARERINEAYARVDRSNALWLPSIRAGMNYFHHEGDVQDVAGNVFRTNKSSFYGGLGANATGSGSPPIPGLVSQFHLSDAIFQPRIAQQQAASRQYAATATRNDTLRNTAIAYLELLRAEQALAISEEAAANTKKLVDVTGNYARTGQGLRSDYERMLAEQAIREADVVGRVECVRVASARLAQLLHADSSVRITTNEPIVTRLDLTEWQNTPASLVATGLMHRPELAEQKHLVCEAVERLNREKYAPLVPSVLLATSYGGFGGGLGNNIINSSDRWDADAVAFWEIRNLGFTERAVRQEASSLIRQSQQRELALMDQVAREVVEAQAQVEEREKRIDISQRSITAAESSYRLNVERIENAQGLPIESLQSVQALAAARLTYLNAVIDFNIAQFELCRAIGWFEDT